MIKLAFTGDVAFSKYFAHSCMEERLLSEKVENFLSDADYTVVNVEGAISSGALRSDKSLTHSNPYECLHWIRRIKGNIWTLANNHTMDCHEEGLMSTLQAARDSGAQTIGIGLDVAAAQKPVIIPEAGGIGVFSVTYNCRNQAEINKPGCFVADDEARVLAQIQEIKSKNRWCIVVSHVGQEFSQMPMPFMRKRYLRYLECGADIVVGHHPHVVQNYETVGEKTIFYSLGNFIFDTDFQRIQKYTDFGMLIKIKFEEDAYSWENLPIHIDRKTTTITDGTCPEIFTDIRPAQYRLLWPLAAKDLCMNERKKFSYHDEAKKRYSWLDWLLKWELPRRTSQVGREQLIGRFLCLFQLWRLADSAIVAYIRKR